MKPAHPKPLASLSLDLDNKWSYLKTHGDTGWDAYPTYLPLVVPRFLQVLQQLQLQMTVFVVGQDAAREENFEALASIAAAGHEIGNHSFQHEPWLHLYTEQQLVSELARTEEHLERVTGQRPVGFRGPGFSFCELLLKILIRRGYQYDCSTFPTYLGPLARMYYFMTSQLSREQRADRKQLFGRFSEGFRTLRPYHWQFPEGRLAEIPVTTMPLFKVPIHVSYVLYLARFSPALARTYWNMALSLCRLYRIGPSLLLHPLDFMGCDDDGDLSFFPAMDQPAAVKVEMTQWILEQLQRHYTVVPMQVHAASLQSGPAARGHRGLSPLEAPRAAGAATAVSSAGHSVH